MHLFYIAKYDLNGTLPISNKRKKAGVNLFFLLTLCIVFMTNRYHSEALVAFEYIT